MAGTTDNLDTITVSEMQQRDTLDRILSAVSQEFRVPKSEIRDRSRFKERVNARFAFYALAKEALRCDAYALSCLLESTHHTSILHGIAGHEARMCVDEVYRGAFFAAKARFAGLPVCLEVIRWVPAVVEFPDDEDSVLLWFGKTEIMCPGFRDAGRWMVEMDDGKRVPVDDDVTHWARYPVGPMAVKGGGR